MKEHLAKEVHSTANDYVGWGLILGIEDSLDDFINDATEVVNSLGTGLPPRDLAAFSSQSTEDGIKLTFTPPAQTYIDDGGTNQFAVMPAGVLIRYSDTGYPRTPDEGKFGYDYKPTGDWVTTSQECTIVGLTKDTKYYFTAFPYSTEHVYNKNQVTANRTEMTWVGNKGTISVTVNTPEGYEGTLGEYTITLVDQASDSPQNVEKTATGAGLTQFGGLTAGKTYKVRLSSTTDLQAPPDSEAITIVGGVNYDVTMTYALMYGTITVNVSTQPAGMPIGQYTVTLTPQGGGDAIQKSGNNSQAVVFENVTNGTTYTVGLSSISNYSLNSGGTVSAVGGQNVSHNATYTFSATFATASFADIQKICQLGKASEFFNVGDKKRINAKKVTYSDIGSTEKTDLGQYTSASKSCNIILLDFNKDSANSITCCSDATLLKMPSHVHSGWSINRYVPSSTINLYYPSTEERLKNVEQKILPSALYSCLKSVTKTTVDYTTSADGRVTPTPRVKTTTDKTFPLSISEFGFPEYAGATEFPSDGYAYFTGNSRRQFGQAIASRSCTITYNESSDYTGTSRHAIYPGGDHGVYTIPYGFSVDLDMIIGFVIG